MADEQYDVDMKMRKLFELKQKQRAAARQYYQNFIYNPHRPVNDGIVFDPALQRFSAMSAYHIEHFKPTAKHWLGFIAYLSPFVFVYYHTKYYKEKQEKLLRSGEVSYSDREFKLLF